MSDDNPLFDVTLFGGPTLPKRTRRPPAAPVDSVVVTGRRWIGISKLDTGVVHMIHPSHVNVTAGTTKILSVCGRKVVPHTFDVDTPRPGCALCWAGR